jgi:hypothetical protein
MRLSKKVLAGAVGLLIAGAAQADTVQSMLTGQVMYGINRTNAALVHYDFASAQSNTVGTVKDSSNTVMTGIEAAAYFPGFLNIFALWENPSDHKNKLVYINTQTAAATVVATDLEGGHFSGACGVATTTDPYTVFAMQNAKVKPPATISGLLNINPNNSTDNEFSLTRESGGTITRDTLKNVSSVDADGTYYQGNATLVHVKPKGNGNQNGLIIDGAAYALQNSNTYDFNGSMQVRLYNDKIKNNDNSPMGHWWLQIISGTVVINNDVQVLTPHRIAKVNQLDGTVTEIMPVSRAYTGLATTNGTVFYTTADKDLYKIDTTLLTETKIGTMSLTKVYGMKFVGGNMMAYDNSATVLAPVSTSTAQNTGTQANLGVGALGPIFFTPAAQDPAVSVGQYD